MRNARSIRNEHFPNEIKEPTAAFSAYIEKHQAIQKQYDALKSETIKTKIISEKSISAIEQGAGVPKARFHPAYQKILDIRNRKIDLEIDSRIAAAQDAYKENKNKYGKAYHQCIIFSAMLVTIPLTIIAAAITGIIQAIDSAITESNIKDLSAEREEKKADIIKDYNNEIEQSPEEKFRFRMFQCAQQLNKENMTETSKIAEVISPTPSS